jgi:hypothetical protein
MSLPPQHPTTLAVLAAVVLQIPMEKKQALLETPSVNELLRNLRQLLRQENRALQIMLASARPQDDGERPFSQN